MRYVRQRWKSQMRNFWCFWQLQYHSLIVRYLIIIGYQNWWSNQDWQILWNSQWLGTLIYLYLMVYNSDSYYWNFRNFKAIYGFVRVSLISWCKLFMEHGLSRGISTFHTSLVFLRLQLNYCIGIFNITPPICVCIDPTCQEQLLANRNERRARELGEPKGHPVSVFTRAFGAIPGFTTSLYCRRESSSQSSA